MEKSEIKEILKSVLFVAGEAVSIAGLSVLFDIEFSEFEKIVNDIAEETAKNNEGLLLMRFGDKLQLCTNREYDSYIQRLLKPQVTERLTNSVLETLSIIAYKQPVTRSEIEEIRGVRCEYAISVLREKGMIRDVGRRDVLGRPVLFGTTEEFMRHFGISSLSELPAVDFSQFEDEAVNISE